MEVRGSAHNYDSPDAEADYYAPQIANGPYRPLDGRQPHQPQGHPEQRRPYGDEPRRGGYPQQQAYPEPAYPGARQNQGQGPRLGQGPGQGPGQGEQYQPRRARHGRPPAEEANREQRRPEPGYFDQSHSDQAYREPAYREPTYRQAPYQEPAYQEPAYREQPYQYRPLARERVLEAEPDYTPAYRPPTQPGATRAGSAASNQHHRKRRKRSRAPIATVSVLVVMAGTAYGLDVAGLLPGVSKSAAAADTKQHPLADPFATSTAALSAAGAASPTPSATGSSTLFPELPGIGTTYGSQIPAKTTQVVVAYGAGLTQYTSTVEFFEKVTGGWQLEDTWSGHNGDGGWVTLANRTAGDLKSPIGVYTLTDAGGKLANPGTKLSYIQSPSFVDYGKGFLGESLLNAFNYVIAINYNHEPGTSPESNYYPMGEAKGGGVWIHVDHGGPTHACISIPQDGVRTLLVNLDPADDPVIVMGDRTDLASN